MRILVVEDCQESAKILKKGLEAQCYAIDLESDGGVAFYRARTNDYDLIILDTILPGRDGPAVCKGLREYHIATPILMLAERADIEEKARFLDCGADDCMTKPYSWTELSARVRALLRRPRNIMNEDVFMVDDLVLDRRTFMATRSGNAVYLTPKEFSLLEYLMKNRGRVLSRAMILEHVWDTGADQFTNAIETHIANLRKKIDADHSRKLIHTFPGRGYQFDVRAA
jgi:DNA-binding response OmpR family regulator